MIGVVVLKRAGAWLPRREPARWRTAAASCSVGPSTSNGRRELAEALFGLAQSARAAAAACAATFWSSLANVANTALEDVDQLGQLLVLAAERFHQQPEVVDRARDVRVARIRSC